MDRDLLVQALIVIVIANTLVIGLALAGSRIRRSPMPAAPARLLPANVAPTDLDAATDAAGASPATEDRPRAPAGPSPARHGAADGSPVPFATNGAPTAVSTAPETSERTPGLEPLELPPGTEVATIGGDELAALAGLEGPAEWRAAIIREGHRLTRGGPPIAVVALQIHGFAALESHFGTFAGHTVVGSVTRTIRELSRRADVVAWVGPATFRMLLFGTDLEGATRYLERIAAAADPWLQAGGLRVRIAAGAAAVSREIALLDAIRLAEERMHDDGRQPGAAM